LHVSFLHEVSMKMRDHHKRAIEKARERLLLGCRDILAILVGGSIAKGTERDDSDVDFIVVVNNEDYEQRLAENRVAFLWRDVCDFPAGYVEGRFVSRAFLFEAAERGSEPTRDSFRGAIPIYCVDPEVTRCLPRIPVYPEERREENMRAFLAQIELNRGYFWNEGKRNKDRFLQMRAATEMVLFGCRLILAHNRILFPCQRRLVETALAAPVKPEGLHEKIDHFLGAMTDEAKEDFCRSILSLTDWPQTDVLSQFLKDSEMAWFHRSHAISER